MRCICCKISFKPTKFNQKSCRLNDECMTSEAMYFLEKKHKADEKKRKQADKERLPFLYPKKFKGLLQNEINLLSRKIDAHFNFLCIDCGKPFGKQTDAAHLHNVQGNENIRYNLHNLHSAKSDCNKFSSEHKVGYRKGIEQRYGLEYLKYIDIEIPKQFKYIGLKENEVVEALKIVRKLNREFDNNIDQFKDGKEAREYFNNLIGIYK